MNARIESSYLLSLVLSGALVACGGGAGGGSNSGPDAAPGGDPGPLYLVHSAVQADATRTNYFTVVDALHQPVVLDYGASLELGGRARLYAEEGIGFFAVGDGEAVTITRYEIDPAGAFAPGDRLSLQAFGVSSMGAQAVHFVSATKAYYKDSGQAQIIVWNPAEMAVEHTIPLPEELVVADRITGLSKWAGRDGEAYFTVSWYSPQYDRVYPGTALVRIDTTTDEMTVVMDQRCRGLNETAAVDGTLYFFSDVINGFGYAVYGDDGGQQDCSLRILPDQRTFDSAYVGSVAPSLGDAQIGVVEAVSEDGQAWLQVVDLDVAATEPGSTYSEWYANGWTWARTDFPTPSQATPIEGEAGAYNGFILGAGDRFFISQAAADYSQTTLVDLSGTQPAPGIRFPGFVLDVARVR